MKSILTTAAVLAAAAMSGCVEREMTITSQPEGALVYVSQVEVGRTPVTLPFTWYGDYDIMLRQDGYQTLHTHAMINMPPYEIPPADLFSAMAPWTYHDRRYLNFEMKKEVPVTDQELIRHAEELRKENLKSEK